MGNFRGRWAGLVLFFVAAVVQADGEAATPGDALTNGEAGLQFRYRAEQVDQDGLPESGFASTVRSRLWYRSGTYRGATMYVELDDLSYVGNDNFNSTRNAKPSYPVIADPSGTDINQFYFRLGNDTDNLAVGRQQINLGNQRFVGAVGWRQNEQTYDALQFNLGTGNLSTRYVWINRVQRIFGPDRGVPAASLDADAHALNLKLDLDSAGTLTGYAYLLDFDNAAAASTRTWGVHYDLTAKQGKFEFPLTVAWASQAEYADSPLNYSADYLLVEAGLKSRQGWSLRVGNERLEGSAGGAFQTPLATLHKFQGWADKFLATPVGGIDDRYISAHTTLSGMKLSAAYHQFDAEAGGARYGSELDVSVGRKLNKHISVLLKVADYNADSFASDTTKVWLMLAASF